MTRFLKHPVTLLVLFWIVFWWPVISGDALLYIRDLTFYTVPMKSYMMERFTAGEFPFWTPYLSSGMPFFADPSHQVLYPLNFLFFFTPTVVHGISWLSISHVLIGMLGMFWLGRVLGLSSWVAAWMAALFGACGYTVSVTDNINYVAGVAWVPLALASFIRGLQIAQLKPRLRYSALGALCVAMMVLAGDTFHPMGLGIFCALGVLLRKSIPEHESPLSLSTACLHLGVMYGLAALICAVQIFPTLELLKLSARNQPMTFEEITIWSFPPMRIIELIQPFFYGSKYPQPHFIGQFMYPAFHEPWADSVYMGIIAVLFAVAGLYFQTRRTWFWLIVMGVALLLAMGFYWGESAFKILMDTFPPITRQRYMEKFVFWVHLSLCLMAGLGAGYLLKNPEALRHRLCDRDAMGKAGLAAALLLGGALFLVHVPANLWIFTHARERAMEWGGHFYERLPHMQGLYLHWVIIMGAATGLIWQTPKTFKKYLVFLMIAALLDLCWAHYNHTPTGKAELLASGNKPAALEIIEADRKQQGLPERPVRIFYDDLTDFTERKDQPDTLEQIRKAYNLPYLNDSYPYHWLFRTLYNQQRLLFNSATPYRVGYHNGRFAPLQPDAHKLYDNILVAHNPGLFAALSGMDYIITPIQPEHLIWDQPHIRTAGIDRRYNLRVLAPDNKTPRVYLSPNALYNPDSANVYKIATASFKSQGEKNRYQFAVELDQSAPEISAGPQKNILPGTIRLITDKPELKTIDVDSPYDTAHLVLSESWFPGWKAWVDDQKTEIILANHRFMAIPVAKGSHAIRFEYHCNGFMQGLVLSIAGLLLCAWLIFPQIIRKQNS